MKILYSADTHVHPGHLDRLLEAAGELQPQAVIIGGDLIPDWKGSIENSIEPHRRWVSRVLLPRLQRFHEAFPQILVLLDLGNDDLAVARPLLEARDGAEFHLLHQRIVEIDDGLVVVGYMVVNPTPFAIKDAEKPDCRDRDGLGAQRVVSSGCVTSSGQALPHHLDPSNGTIEEDLDALSAVLESEALSDYSFLFVCHAPPWNTALDQMANHFHAGSLAVRRFLERWGATGRLVASFHGHIHEAPWMSERIWDLVGGVPAFNGGQHSRLFRALLVDTDAVLQSARLVTVTRTGEIDVVEGAGVGEGK